VFSPTTTASSSTPSSTATGSSTTTQSTSTQTSATTVSPTSQPLDCHSDNCIREIQNVRFSASASVFCVTYTISYNPNPSAIPAYLENCNRSLLALSSACSCLYPVPTSSPTPTPTPCTLAPFSAAECGTTEPASGLQAQNFAIECGQTYDTSLAALTTTAGCIIK
jgi:hypothetical protein